MRVCQQVRDGTSSIYEHVCMKECGSSLHLSKCILLNVGMGVFANVFVKLKPWLNTVKVYFVVLLRKKRLFDFEKTGYFFFDFEKIV